MAQSINNRGYQEDLEELGFVYSVQISTVNNMDSFTDATGLFLP